MSSYSSGQKRSYQTDWRTGEKRLSLHHPERNVLAAKGGARGAVLIPPRSGVPHRFYPRALGADQLGKSHTVQRLKSFPSTSE